MLLVLEIFVHLSSVLSCLIVCHICSTKKLSIMHPPFFHFFSFFLSAIGPNGWGLDTSSTYNFEEKMTFSRYKYIWGLKAKVINS